MQSTDWRADYDLAARTAGERWVVINMKSDTSVMRVPGDPGALFIDAADSELLSRLDAAGVFESEAKQSIANLAHQAAAQGVEWRVKGDLERACIHQRFAAIVAVQLRQPDGIEATVANLWVLREGLRDVAERALGPAGQIDAADALGAVLRSYEAGVRWASNTIASDARRLANSIRERLDVFELSPATMQSFWLTLHRLARMSNDGALWEEATAKLQNAANAGISHEALLAATESLAEFNLQRLLCEVGLISGSQAQPNRDLFGNFLRLRGAFATDANTLECITALRAAFGHLEFLREEMTASGGAFGHELSYAVSPMLQAVGRDLGSLLLRTGDCEGALQIVETILARSMTDWMTRTHALRGLPKRFRAAINPLTGSGNATEPAQLAEVRGAAVAEGPLLFLADLPEGPTAWVVRRDGHIMHANLPALGHALAEAQSVLPFLAPGATSRDLGPSSPQKDSREAQETALARLYDALFVAELREVLTDAGGRLVVVADPAFNCIPFAALRDPTGHYLVENLDIEHWPSVTARLVIDAGAWGPNWRRARREAPVPPLVMGIGDFASKYPKVDHGSAVALAQLPGARDEAKAVATQLHTRAFLDDEATRERLYINGHGADIVHLATHAYLDEAHPMASFLALADGPVSAGDLYQEDRGLRIGLAVASACQTGLGGGHPDSIIGLANALLIAGSQAVVTTLWKVPDAETAAVMCNFYSALRDGGTISAAMRCAQTQALRNPATRDPFFWGAMRVTGWGLMQPLTEWKERPQP